MVVEPRGVEPRNRILNKLLTLNKTQTSLVLFSLNRNFQSCAYTMSAKVPVVEEAKGLLTASSLATR